MLFRNVYRTLKRQYIQLLLLGVIITLSSFMYTVMDYAIVGVKEPTDQYFIDANQEKFSIKTLDLMLEDDITYITNNCPAVTEIPYTISSLKAINESCYYDLQEYRISILTSEYPNIFLELREFKDVYFDYGDVSYKIRALKDSNDINLSTIVDGEKPLLDTEIAVSEMFAISNGLELYDTITIQSTTYTISGFVLFPDYSLAVFSNDLIFDNKTQTPALFSNTEFESLNATIQFELAGEYNNDYDDDIFKTEVIDTFHDRNLDFVSSVVLTINNIRSGAIYADLNGGRAQSIGLSLLISGIALMIVGIMVSKVLNKQRGAIGILKSLGYKNSEIALPYIFFIAIMALPTVILGYYLGYLAADPMKNMFLLFYLLPANPIQQSALTFFISVITPFSFILGVSYLIIIRMLRQKPVELLNPEVSSSANIITKKVGKLIKKLSITSKLQHLLLYRNLVKFAVFFIGMFYAAFLIYLSLGMVGIYDRMLFDYYDNTSHDYIGYCDYQTPCIVSGTQEKVLELPSALLDEEEVYIVGLNSNTVLHPLYDKHHNIITSDIDSGLVITKSLSVTKGFRIGDNLTLQIGDNEITLRVEGITEEYSGNKAYYNIEDLAVFIGQDASHFNTVYSETPLDAANFMVVINTQNILEQAYSMQQFFNVMIYLMIIVSIVIGAIIIYILSVMTVEDNFYNISLFKVIGYNDKEINKMVLGGYLTYGVLAFLLAIPSAIVSFYAIEILFAQFYDLLFPIQFVWWHGLIALLIYFIIFLISGYVAKRNLKQISLQEAMKMYQI